jgi:hypothetical protein
LQTTLPRVCRIDWRRMTSERRAFLRVEAELDVICTRVSQTRLPVRLKAVVRRLTPDGHAVEEFAAPTVDVSIDGVQISTERLLEVGGRVEVSIDFADSIEPFTATALVAWQRPAGERLTFGLEFADIKPALQRQLIERTLAAEKRRDA